MITIFKLFFPIAVKLVLCFFSIVSISIWAEVKLPSKNTVQSHNDLAAKNASIASSLNMSPVEQCEENLVLNVPSGEVYDSSQELGVLEAPASVTYGLWVNKQGIYAPPKCGLKREKVIKIPVLLVDWEDFNPATDLSNPNNPNSTFPNYQKKSASEFSEWLNGQTGPAQYFKDVSGGFVKLEFDVIGWLESAETGSYLQTRSSYMTFNEENQLWNCDKDSIMRDAMRDAVALNDVDFSEYNVDSTAGSSLAGIIDGMVLVYEGGPGLCSGNNMSWFSGSHSTSDYDEFEIYYEQISGLVQGDDPNFVKFSEQTILYEYYNNISEYKFTDINVEPWRIGTWNHELGHLLLGFPDYYYPRFNMGQWGLSASSSNVQPAAWEKALYGRWFEFNEIDVSENYRLLSSDIADGAIYENDTYIYKILINDDPNHYLTIEYRWLEPAGNTQSSWVKSIDSRKESGLQIVKFNWNSDVWDEESPQVKRYTPFSEDVWFSEIQSFKGSDTFNKCFEGNFCVVIDKIEFESNVATFDLNFNIDTDGDGIENEDDTDDDNDGIEDNADAFPLDATESVDTDNDGIGNNTDTDDDGDGIEDNADAFPLDATESVDTDNDGIGNNTDTDDDGDGIEDNADAFPLDATESVDTDNDGIGNNTDTDDDGDGIEDNADAFPLDATESVDTDNDGIGNNTDTDDDGDGIEDNADAFPLDATESVDTDNDGIGNNTDTDDDGDGIEDNADAFPLDATESVDTDNDGIGNNTDTDDDGDGIEDNADAFPLDATESVDTDNDGIGNNTDTDDDGDGIEDNADAFPLDATESVDTDNDGIGNNADTDDDGDGVTDSADAFPLDANKSVVSETQSPSSSGGGGSSSGFIFLLLLISIILRKFELSKNAHSNDYIKSTSKYTLPASS